MQEKIKKYYQYIRVAVLDALLINARTVPALSESNSLHPAQEFCGIITQSTKASHNKRVSNSILVCRGFLVFVFLVGFRCSEDLAVVDLDLCKLMGEWCNACDINNSIAPLALPLGLRGITILSGEYPLTLLGSSIIPVDDVQFFLI